MQHLSELRVWQRGHALALTVSCARVLALVVLLAARGLAEEAAWRQAPEGGCISGTVKDAQTGAPISGADVFLETENAGAASRASTDDSGGYSFGALAPGRYRVMAAKIGYQQRHYGRDAVFGDPIPLTRGRVASGRNILLDRAAGIAGFVFDESRGPAHPCYVFFDPMAVSNRTFHTMTDEEGHYWVADLPPGRYKVSARRFSPAANQVVGEKWFYPSTVEPEAAEPVTLEAGVQAQIDIVFGEGREPVWAGRVTDEDGEPIAQAEMEIVRLDGRHGEHLWTCRSGPDGRCEVRDLRPGPYRVSVTRAPPPYAPWTNPDPASTGERAYAKRVLLQRGASPVTEFRLRRGLTLRGRFRTLDGGEALPEHGIQIEMRHAPDPASQGMAFYAFSTNDGPGTFHVDGLVPRRPYRLAVRSSDPSLRWCVVGFLRGGAAVRQGTIAASEQQDPQPLEVLLSRTAVLSGTWAGTGAVAATRVRGPRLPHGLYPETFETEVQRSRFIFTGLPPGTYRISPARGSSLEVSLGAGEETAIRLP